ncbi:Mu-like prophage protein gpG [Actinobacillus equuli]|nr:Mu-like prophage protein gpG [Actinobacillus equuli]
MQHPRKLHGVLGETLKKIHAERFKQEIDPEGNHWQPLSNSTLAQKRKRGKSTKSYDKMVTYLIRQHITIMMSG